MAYTSFYNDKELLSMGFKSIGKDCRISRNASFYDASRMIIGNNVRIDDFCILTGDIKLGSNIHISAYVALYGSEGIEFEDNTGISPRSTIYSAMDDFSGDYLIGPIHPEYTTNITGGKVFVRKYCQIGCNSVVFPDLTINEGAVIGAMSLVVKSVESWTVNVGVPSRVLKYRSRDLLKFV